MKIKLIVTLNKELMSLSFINQQEITVGRDVSNTIAPLTADGLSRRHARLFVENGKWFVEDCGSTNGTYKMGTKLEGREELKVHDLLQFGKLEISVESILSGDEPITEPAPAPTARTEKTLELPRPVPPISPIGIKKPETPAPAVAELEPVAELTPVEEVKELPKAAPAAAPALTPVAKPGLKPGLKLPPHKTLGSGIKLPPKKPMLGAGLKLPPRPILKVPPKKPAAPAS